MDALIPAGGGGTQRLPRLVGRMRATQILISGRFLTADEAHSWGTVDQVVRERADAPRPIVSEDAREGIAAFIEKRQPQFGGEGR